MKRLERIIISNNYELLFAKRTLKNLSTRYKINDYTFLEFALMELGTNLFKHSSGGEVWILENNKTIGLAVLDRGNGIKDIQKALTKGNSRLANSLGLGLYSVSSNLNYSFNIFSQTKEHSDFSGTVATLFDINNDTDRIFFSLSYLDMEYSGDFYLSKGRYGFFGDIAGHGKKAYDNLPKINDFFDKTTISCLTMDNFFANLHSQIIQCDGRSLVGCVFEDSKEAWNFCGVGNIALFELNIAEKKIHLNYFADGIIGEAYRKHKSMTIVRSNKCAILATDGIGLKRAYRIIDALIASDKRHLAIILAWFARENDDASLMIFS